MYLIRKQLKKKTVAHLWDGLDTECRMASTGGLRMKRYEVYSDPRGREICYMCRKNSEKKASEFQI